MSNFMLIGLTGRIASGKGIVANYFQNKGFIYFSLSQAVREEAKKRKIEIIRKNLQDLGNELREKEGGGVWARKIIKNINNGNYIIDGIRNPVEVEEFKRLKDFYLISIDAFREIRYQRVLDRAKPSDPKTWEEFLEMDERDFCEENSIGQQVGKCMEMADFSIINNLSLEILNEEIEKVYSKIRC